MTVQLKSVIAHTDEMHTILEIGHKHKIEVLPDTRLYFKAKVDKLNSPIKLLIITDKD